MKIEDRIERLERIVQRAHAAAGHQWFRGSQWTYTKPETYRKECFCGEDLESTKEEWESLPHRDWPDPERDRY